MRTRPRERKEIGPRHARPGRSLLCLVVPIWWSGVASTLWLRDDLELAASPHFRIGTAIAALLTASAMTARAMERGSVQARKIHPWLGAAAALLAAAQAV